jgi:hypothetical protein
VLDALHATRDDLADGERVSLATLSTCKQVREGRVRFLLLAAARRTRSLRVGAFAGRSHVTGRRPVFALPTATALTLLRPLARRSCGFFTCARRRLFVAVVVAAFGVVRVSLLAFAFRSVRSVTFRR